MSKSYGAQYQYKKKAIATLDQTPTVNVWYTVLGTTKNVKVLYFALMQAHTEAGNEDVNIRVTIDGVSVTSTANLTLADSTPAYAYLSPVADALILGTTLYNAAYTAPLEAHSIKVEVRQTTAVGTAPKIYGYVQYEVKEIV